MKTKNISYLCLALLLAIGFTACRQKNQTAGQVNKAQNKTYYTCSMHPQVHEDHPGNCPICQMKLIRVEVTGMDDAAAGNKIVLTAAQIKLAGIQTDTVKAEDTGDEKTISGTVTTDQNQSATLSARVGGRVERLYIRTTGETVAIGQPVYSIYSEDIEEAEKEYLLAKEQQKKLNNPDVDYKQLTSAAENKLRLWGLSAGQIKSLAASAKASATVTILSNISGTVSDIAVHEGDYVTEGMTILKTQALNSLWVQAQLYAGESAAYQEHQEVSVTLPDLGGQVIKGRVDFLNPELSDASKVDLMRVAIPNPRGLVRPGMQAYIAVGSGKQRTLAVPASAVLTSGKGSMVWIKNADGSFSPRMITPGTGNSNYVAVVSGLNAGEVVVSNGAYLLNSESIFKNGDKAMAGMKM